MEEQKKTSSTMTIALSIILTAVLFGGGTYLYTMNIKDKEIADLNTQIVQLQSDTVADTALTARTTTTDETAELTIKKQACGDIYPDAIFDETAGQSKAKIGQTHCSVSVLLDNFAKGGYGQVADENGGGGSSAWIAAKIENKWTKIQTTQDQWVCETLREYNVPSSLILPDRECVSTATGQTEEY